MQREYRPTCMGAYLLDSKLFDRFSQFSVTPIVPGLQLSQTHSPFGLSGPVVLDALRNARAVMHGGMVKPSEWIEALRAGQSLKSHSLQARFF